MTNDEFYAVQNGELPLSVADTYLNIYVAKQDWSPHIKVLWNESRGKFRDQMKNIISCTVLLQSVDNTTRIDPYHPETLMFRVPYFHQYQERDWFKLLQKTIEKDNTIDLSRTQILGLGVIAKIKFDPMSRQAFNWLYEKAEATGAVIPETKDDIVERFTNLVMAYGGAVICSIFTRHEAKLKKVLNWRTGYFFEHVIHQVYTIDEIIKIKKADLDRANPSLVKKVLIGA